MVKAKDLIKSQEDKKKLKEKTYRKILERIEKKISIASNSDFYYTYYEIPEFILGLPLYSIKDCILYVKKKLEKNGFKVLISEPNILLISWQPN
ncbi:hypothetical protein [Chlorella virus XW01]|nr:hypothetical protein [Chlorella virus XW01]